MQRSFYSAFCLTLVISPALADGSYNPVAPETGFDNNNWRPIAPPADYQPAPESLSMEIPVHPQQQNYAGHPDTGYSVPGTGTPYAVEVPTGGYAPPATYEYGSPAPYAQSPYAYPPIDYQNDWNYPSAPGYPSGYYQAPAYSYPYQYDTAPAYAPYGGVQSYGYPQGYGQEYYIPAQPMPEYESSYYPDRGGAGYDQPYGGTQPLPVAPPMQGYLPAPGQAGQEAYPAYAAPPTYPQQPAQPQAVQPPAPGASSNPANQPHGEWRPLSGNATQGVSVPPAAAQGSDYMINGAPAVFRPWTEPVEEVAPEEPASQ